MDLTLHVQGDVIAAAKYDTYPCPGCVACGKAICEIVTGMRCEEAAKVDHPTLVERVGPLSRHRQICYSLAVLALADALKRLGR